MSSMSLLTPPNTVQKGKDLGCPSSRLVWAPQNSYHSFTASPPRLSVSASSERSWPTRSILKNITRVINFEPEEAREITPEPSDPLKDAHYLERAITIITSADTPMRDLVDAYNTLTTRMRAAVPESADPDRSWPLLRPLRQQREAFVTALSRDLSKALINPSLHDTAGEVSCEKENKVFLPSPKASPSKKRHGLTEEQVTYARDLFSTAQATLKFLAVALSLPAVCGVFTTTELRSILTDILAIPMADELPTPNARKTHGSAILVLQVQRLPAEILFPARDRIAYALRRAIDGELGKEGKRGAMFEGLKAIHDLSLYQSATFVPAFTELLSSVLAGLLAPTLVLRTQAAYALGGFALALAAQPTGLVHTRASAQVAEFLTTPPEVRKSPASPGSPVNDPLIIRTLRTTLNAPDPQHPAQGPAWALCVLASLVVILGSRVYTEAKILRCVNALLKMTMKHRKSTVRGLGCMVWRAITWVYFQPALPFDEEETTEDEAEADDDADEDDRREFADRRERDTEHAREKYWDTVQSIVEMGTGVCTVAALMGDESETRDDEEAIQRTVTILRSLVRKGSEHVAQAVDALQQLLGQHAIGEDTTLEEVMEAKAQAGPWSPNKLLAPGLFSAQPGILTAEYKTLSTAVRPLFEQSADAGDIRWLTKEELESTLVHNGLLAVWKDVMMAFKWQGDAQAMLVDLNRIWGGLLTSRMGSTSDDVVDQECFDYARKVGGLLVDFAQDPTFCSVPGEDGDDVSSLVPKFATLRALVGKVKQSMPHTLFSDALQPLLPTLISTSNGLDEAYSALEAWARLCGEIIVASNLEELKAFCELLADEKLTELGWTFPSLSRTLVWKQLVQVWRDDRQSGWEGAILLLSTPFASKEDWELDSEDFHVWDALLQVAMDKAADCGYDRAFVLSSIAGSISKTMTPSTSLPVRVADLLVGSLEIGNIREIPTKLLDFANESLCAAYQRSAHHMVECFWLIRSLTNVIEACPSELLCDLLSTVQDGMNTWISDDHHVITEDDYTLNMVPLYQAVLFAVQALCPSMEALEQSADILHAAFRGRADKPEAITQSFQAFWEVSYAKTSTPARDWPAPVQLCLDALMETPAVAQINSAESVKGSSVTAPIVIQDSDDEEPLSFPDSDEEDNVDTLLKPSFTPEKTPEQVPLCPSTPRRASSPVCSTTHPAKRPPTSKVGSSTIFPRLAASPVVATVPVTPKRTSASPSRSSKKSADKENVSPHKIVSVMDRMIARYAESPTKLGKRREPISDGDASETNIERAAKRLKANSARKIAPSPKINSLASDKTPTQAAVHSKPSASVSRDSVSKCVRSHLGKALQDGSDLEDNDDSDGSDFDTPSKAPPSFHKKRKRVLMESVELPTLELVHKQKTKRRSSLDLVVANEDPKENVLRRTQSARMAGQDFADRLIKSLPRKRKNEDPIDITQTPRSSVTVQETFTPIKSLLDEQIIGSDDSIMLEQAEAEAELPSSDDSPHLGLVTPRHVVSPGIRRFFDDTDPPSDDPVPSPSRDHVARRLERQGSMKVLPKLKPLVYTRI